MNPTEQQAALLEQYSAALANDFAAAPPADLAQDTAITLQHLRRELRDATPSPAFRTRLRQQLAAQAATAMNPNAQPMGRTEHTLMQSSTSQTSTPLLARPLLRFAIAALVLMVIATSAVLLGGPLLQQANNPAITQPSVKPAACNGLLGPWQDIAALNQQIAVAAAASDDHYLYLVGGTSSLVPNQASNQLFRYDPAANTWASLAAAPDSFVAASAVYAANSHKLYVFGGVIGPNIQASLTRIYDPATNTWSAGAAMPQPRAGMAVAYWNGRIYLVGGGYGANYDPQNQTWAYDPLANTWDTTLAPIPLSASGTHGGAINGHLYVAGGLAGAQRTAATYDYDIAANAWQQRASLPQPLEEAGSAVVGNRFYVFGGADSVGEAVATSYSYDPASDSWVTGAPLTQARTTTAGASIGNTIYVVGGFNRSGMFSSAQSATVSCAGK